MQIKKTFQSDYSKKLLDPRWQRKRLEILERDEWCCQSCFDNEATLHVHHLIYQASNPWETKNKFLLTLCDKCHERETKLKKPMGENLVKFFSECGFLFGDMEWEIAKATPVELQHGREVVLSSIFYALTDEKAQKSLVKTFLDSLGKKEHESNKDDYLENFFKESVGGEQ